jgi:hypothetical protein
VAAGATCSVSVDVLGNAVGVLGNTSGELTSTLATGGASRSSGKASASLNVSVERISLVKLFTDDPVAPGATVNLEFTVRNLDRRSPASNIAFTDDLGATLSGLVATGLPQSEVCGAGSSLIGTDVISLAGGSLEAEQSCTFSVSLQVPDGAPAGQFGNTTSEVAADVGGDSVIGDPASDVLFVAPAPRLEKTFLDNPVGAGGTTELQFSVTNTSPDQGATGIGFTDSFDVILPTADGWPAPPNNVVSVCNGGAASFVPLVDSSFGGTPAQLSVSDANLDPAASCSFSITLDVVEGAPAGTYFNTTSAISAVVDGISYTGNPASAELDVVGAPRLNKLFTDDPALPGGTVTLEFPLSHDENASADATDITFSDDLEAVLTGLVAVGLPASDVCGAGSQITGTGNLVFTGGSLAPGESCTFSVTLQVPGAPPPGAHTNTTSNVQATVLGVTATGNPASGDLEIAGLALRKEFTDDPVLAGDTVTLRFTLDNLSPVSAAGAIAFNDDLDDTLPGLAVAAGGLPQVDVCGPGSSLLGAAGDSFLMFIDGSLAPQTSCSFDVILQVPATAEPNRYVNTTSAVSASVDGVILPFDPATDRLEVEGDLLTFSKEFIDDPADPGGTTNLRFTLGNLSLSQTLTDIAFTDDLDAALAGLVSSAGPLADVCGPGSTLSGTSLLIFSGGSLAPGASCSFDVPLSVPSDVPIGTVYTNDTSEASANAGGLAVTAPAASDVLAINFLAFSKAIDYGPGNDAANPGGSVNLSFTIENLNQNEAVGELAFIDDLDAVLPGLVATGLPLSDLCGTGSLVSGDALISLSDGSVAPNGSCTITLALAVPADAEPGDYLNTTGNLRQAGVPVAGPASAMLRLVDIGDDDGDGVPNDEDFCPGTVIPEAVPTIRLGVNRFALVDADGIFDTTLPPGQAPSDLIEYLLGLPGNSPPAPGANPPGPGGNPPGPSVDPSGLEGLFDLLVVPTGAAGANSASGDTFPPAGTNPGGASGSDLLLQTAGWGPPRSAAAFGDPAGSGFEPSATRELSGNSVFTIEQTAGCSCEQIVDAFGLGQGHTKFGCSLGAMEDWVDYMNGR